MTPDVNVLVAASRSDHPHNDIALSWLNTTLLDCKIGRNLKILPMVASGFLRLVTHPKIFNRPTPVENAVSFIEALLAVPGVDMVQELGREWPAFCQLCRTEKLRGNAIPDAWIAVSARACSAHLVTFDKGFKKLLNKNEFTLLEV